MRGGESGDDDEESPSWSEDEAAIHLFGKKIQGFTFSPKADLSCVWYNKLREKTSHQKGWMSEIHERGGWQKGMPLIRIEARFKRGILRELSQVGGDEHKRWFDDPWEVLKHLSELWAYFAGLPLESDHAPDVTHRGWMRLVDGQDTNCSRLGTSALWQMVQRVPFGTETPKPLKRSKRIDPALEHLLAEIYGMLKTVAVQRGSYKEGDAVFSRELEYLDDWAAEMQEQRGQTFAQEVHERARMLGNPLPLVSDSMSSQRKR